MDLQRYIPPNLRPQVRDARNLGYSLLDNVIGFDDGFESAGERLGAQIRTDPIGTGRAVAQGIGSGVQGLISDPVGAVRGAAQGFGDAYQRARVGADSYLPEGVTLKDASMDQIRAANEAYLADVTTLSAVVPFAGPAANTAKAAGRATLDVADRIEYDPTMVGSMGGNVKLRPAGPMEMRGSDYFDPPNPNAGRSRDPAMYTPFSATKAKNAPYTYSASGVYLGQNAQPELITPEMQQGKRMFFAAGDRTAGDVELRNVGNIALRRPVRLYAGPEYMDTGDTWASHKGVMTPKQNVLLPAIESGEDVGFAYTPMGERSGDFARHQGQLFSEMLYSSKMPRKSAAKVNEVIKSIADAQSAKDLARLNKARVKEGRKPLTRAKSTKVPSITSEGFRDWFDSQSAEGVRKPFLQAMDASPMKALEGVPDVGEARFAATNPELVQSEWGSTGFRFGTPDVSRGLLEADHPTYDTKLAAKEGSRSQTYGQQIPWTIAARDTALPRLAKSAMDTGAFRRGQNVPFSGRRSTLPSDQRVFTMNPKTSQMIDQQYVDEATTYMDIARTQGPQAAEKYEMGLIEAYLRGL